MAPISSRIFTTTRREVHAELPSLTQIITPTLILVLLSVATVVAGQEPIFEPEPVWYTEDLGNNRGLSATLGDVDEDGDLDIIIHFQLERGVELYGNDLSPQVFTQSTIWAIQPVYPNINGLPQWGWDDFGDVDHDGDLDLVIAWAGPTEELTPLYNSLILNDDGFVLPNTVWEAPVPSPKTRRMTLVDLDGDGDIDLVCGGGYIGTGTGYHGESPDTVYRNEGMDAVFTLTPVWNSSAVHITMDLALGDLDGDGDPDLLCGNVTRPMILYEPRPNTLYLNYSDEGDPAIFRPDPDWEYEPDVTFALALGDVDGDGDLDLASARADSCIVYLNRYSEGGTWSQTIFDSTPVWSLAGYFPAIALGDIDRDGDLDLLCGGNSGVFVQNLAVYLNVGGPEVFALTPSQEIDPGPGAEDIVLGDVDVDGDLDLITVDFWEGVQLRLNTGSVLASPPSEPMILPNQTWDVALADLDGDGHLDLFCANDGQSSVYLNTPTWPDIFLPAPPQWSNQFPAPTRSLALGDVNGDGNLDLALGNLDESNWLFVNDGTGLSTVPTWISDETAATFAVALGDVDGDGDPDLVSGNLGEPNQIHFNQAGNLETFSTWQTNLSRDTRSLALADVNADGRIDLICGNDGRANTLYLGSGRAFSVDPDWESELEKSTTWSVALGDVDADGDLDLVCGNEGEPNTLYRNYGGELGRDPAWSSSEADSTRGVALQDVSGDGLLDLVCANFGGETAVYLNQGGSFPLTASWRAAATPLATSVAVGDLDHDGDADLAVGALGQVNSLHFGLRNPVYSSDPGTRAHKLAFNPTAIINATAQLASANLYRIELTAVDADDDVFWLRGRYRYSNESVWRPLGESSMFGPLAASPDGSLHQIDWDVSQFPFDPRDVVLDLQVIETPQTISEMRHAAAYELNMGPLEVRRSEIVTAPDSLVFPTVALGDTVSAAFTMANPGNEALEVSEVILPGVEMWLDDTVPFTVAAGDTHTCTIHLAPVQEMAVEGAVQVSSNAPLSPVILLTVQTDIRPLTAEIRPLLEGETAPLGEALTVLVVPEVPLDRCALHYRPDTGGAAFTTLAMTPQGNSFIGVIPGQDVTEAGLCYFVELENSGVLAVDPDQAPDVVHCLAVESPARVVVTPTPNSEAGFLENRPVRIEVALPQGAVFQHGTLHYRMGGSATFDQLALQWEGTGAVATIPAAMAGPRGLEYWIGVKTESDSLTSPAASPLESPHTLAVAVQYLQESTTAPAEHYRLVSVPLRFGEEFTGTLEALLSDQAEFGSYDPLRWRSFRWLPGDGQYVELSDPDHAAAFRPEPGRGFWLICRQESRIMTAPITGSSTPTDSAAVIVLAPGWNQIGQPFAFPVTWDAVLVDGSPMGDATGVLIDPPWRWDPAAGYRQDVTALQPFAGYFVFNRQDVPVNLQVPPREFEKSIASPEEGDAQTPPSLPTSPAGWSLQLVARCGDIVDGENWLGVCPGASLQSDRHDRLEPPPNPRYWLSLYFPHPDWTDHPGHYAVDIHDAERSNLNSSTPAGQQGAANKNGAVSGHSWFLDIVKDFSLEDVADQITLEFHGQESIPQHLGIVLLDQDLLRTQDLRVQSFYTFLSGNRNQVSRATDARFRLLIGDQEYIADQGNDLAEIPLHTCLHPNRPNPFNPSTVIRYDIAQAGRISLRIYDVSGALVKTLKAEHHEPGRYEVVWRGDDQRGHRVAAGVYFSRLELEGHHRQIQKMLLVK